MMDITISLDCSVTPDTTLRVKSTLDQTNVLILIDPGNVYEEQEQQFATVCAQDLIRAIMLACGLTKDELE